MSAPFGYGFVALGFKRLALVLLACATLAGCHSPGPAGALQRYKFQQPHMGTLFAITLYAPDETAARQASDAAFAKIAALERCLTDYDPESELMQLCQQPVGRPVRVSEELFEILDRSRRLAELSDGAFDPTIGPVVRLWRRARRVEALPPPDQLARARERVGWRKLELDAATKTATLLAPEMQLDLGGIAKGFAADRALAVLREQGLKRALVAASGDIATGEPPPGQRGWRVSIGAPVSDPAGSEDGSNQAEAALGAPVARTLLLRNAAVSTSGDAEQSVEIDGQRYSHIVDPRTGIGLTERVQVTVVGRRAADTDAFATAVSVLGVERGLALIESQPGLAALVLVQEGHQLRALESPWFNRWIQAR